MHKLTFDGSRPSSRNTSSSRHPVQLPDRRRRPGRAECPQPAHAPSTEAPAETARCTGQYPLMTAAEVARLHVHVEHRGDHGDDGEAPNCCIVLSVAAAFPKRSWGTALSTAGGDAGQCDRDADAGK